MLAIVTIAEVLISINNPTVNIGLDLGVSKVGEYLVDKVFGGGRQPSVDSIIKKYATQIIESISSKIDEQTLDLKTSDARVEVGSFVARYNRWVSLSSEDQKVSQISELEDLINRQGDYAIGRLRELHDIGLQSQMAFFSTFLACNLDLIRMHEDKARKEIYYNIMKNCVVNFTSEIETACSSLKSRIDSSCYVKSWNDTTTGDYFPHRYFAVYDAFKQKVVWQTYVGGPGGDYVKAYETSAFENCNKYKQGLIDLAAIGTPWESLKDGWKNLLVNAEKSLTD